MTHIETSHLERMLVDLDQYVKSSMITKAEYMQIGIQLKILQTLIEIRDKDG
jgi:hypothetical protein